MTNRSVQKSIEDLLAMSADGLKGKLLPFLKELEKYGVGRFIAEQPLLLSRILNKLKQIDAARFFNEAPHLADPWSDFFWQGVRGLAAASPEMKTILDHVERTCTVNVEASDSPLQNHFIVRKGDLTGGAGLVHFKDEDFRFMGPTRTLIDLLTGDLPLGFSNLNLQTAGHSGWVRRILPVIRGINKILKEP
jgi:hypothetical protein